jgi:hypothetical protein
MKLDIDPIYRSSFTVKQAVISVRSTLSQITELKLRGVHVRLIDFFKDDLCALAHNQIAENLTGILAIVIIGTLGSKQVRYGILGVTECPQTSAGCPDFSGNSVGILSRFIEAAALQEIKRLRPRARRVEAAENPYQFYSFHVYPSGH